MKNVDIPLSIVLGHKIGKPYQISSKTNRIKNLFHDSRKAITDGWFLCLKGDQSNGHDHIQSVLDKRVNHVIYETSQTNLRPPGIHVADTNLFLANIASWWREQMKSKVILITGSNGKTSTKELLYFLLKKIVTEETCIIKSLGSFNNHFGLPFTLLDITGSTFFAVVEAGTNHPGEIKTLSEWSSPDYALITSIQKGHLGHFKNEKAIAEEKSDILYSMKVGGHIVFPEDIAFKNLIIKKAEDKGVHFSETSAKIQSISNVISKEDGTSFKYKNTQYFLPLLGRHQFNNLILAIGLLQVLQDENKISEKNISEALSHLHTFKNAPGRMDIYKKENIKICDDSYNANPSSFEATILSLSEKFSQNQLLGALGYMAELGSHEEKEHRALARLAAKHFKAIIFLSPTKNLSEAFRDEWIKMRSPNEIFVDESFINVNGEDRFKKSSDFLKKFAEKDDCFLVKGSRSARMEKMLTYL